MRMATIAGMAPDIWRACLRTVDPPGADGSGMTRAYPTKLTVVPVCAGRPRARVVVEYPDAAASRGCRFLPGGHALSSGQRARLISGGARTECAREMLRGNRPGGDFPQFLKFQRLHGIWKG